MNVRIFCITILIIVTTKTFGMQHDSEKILVSYLYQAIEDNDHKRIDIILKNLPKASLITDPSRPSLSNYTVVSHFYPYQIGEDEFLSKVSPFMLCLHHYIYHILNKNDERASDYGVLLQKLLQTPKLDSNATDIYTIMFDIHSSVKHGPRTTLIKKDGKNGKILKSLLQNPTFDINLKHGSLSSYHCNRKESALEKLLSYRTCHSSPKFPKYVTKLLEIALKKPKLDITESCIIAMSGLLKEIIRNDEITKLYPLIYDKFYDNFQRSEYLRKNEYYPVLKLIGDTISHNKITSATAKALLLSDLSKENITLKEILLGNENNKTKLKELNLLKQRENDIANVDIMTLFDFKNIAQKYHNFHVAIKQYMYIFLRLEKLRKSLKEILPQEVMNEIFSYITLESFLHQEKHGEKRKKTEDSSTEAIEQRVQDAYGVAIF